MGLVSVPPRISSRDLETDLVVRENENLTLSCDADGHPKPLVVWRREDGEPITVHGSKGWKNELLDATNGGTK